MAVWLWLYILTEKLSNCPEKLLLLIEGCEVNQLDTFYKERTGNFWFQYFTYRMIYFDFCNIYFVSG